MNTGEDTASNITPQVKNKKIKIFISILVGVILMVGVLGIWFYGTLNLNQGSNNKDTKNKLNSALDNPVVMKVAESLPIPKITLVPVTLMPVSPTQAQGGAGEGLVDNMSETGGSDTLAGMFDTERSTYVNNELKFSIDYPTDYKVEENSYGLGVSQVNFISPNNNDPANYPDMQMLIYPSQIGKLIGQDFDSLYSLDINSTQKMSSGTIEPRLFTVVEKKLIGGNKAFDFTTTDDPPDENKEVETGTYIYARDMIFIISTGESGKTLLEKMILTFRLI